MAVRELETPETSCLRNRQLEARHLIEFPSDSFGECVGDQS